MVVESRVPVQRFVQHKQGLKVDPRCGEVDHECHHVIGRGGMADRDDAEDAEVLEDLVGSLEQQLPAPDQDSNRETNSPPGICLVEDRIC